MPLRRFDVRGRGRRRPKRLDELPFVADESTPGPPVKARMVPPPLGRERDGFIRAGTPSGRHAEAAQVCRSSSLTRLRQFDFQDAATI